MRELVVIGMGHIGGSIAAGARLRGIAQRVVGVERDPEHRMQARDARLADVVTEDFASACAKADLVVVAVPPSSTASVALEALAAAPRAVVTDVAGLKAAIVAQVSREGGAGAKRFVGGHPMAGTAGSGPKASRPELFEGRRVVVTPVDSTDPAALAVVEGMWRGLGATPVRETPEAHDRAVTAVSHLPHAIAWSLSLAAAELLAPNGDLAAGAERAAAFAGPSFEGATRVAASDPALWRELLVENGAGITEAIAVLRARLEDLSQAIERERGAAGTPLLDLLRQAQALASAPKRGES